MINEDKIRKACSSDRERGFRLLVDSFQEPIYNYIRRMVVSHEDAEDVQEELMSKLKASDYVDYEDELAVKFQEAILTLPEKQRIVFNLRYYDELEYEDIARVLDSKVETLKVNYHYAKDKIKEYILNR